MRMKALFLVVIVFSICGSLVTAAEFDVAISNSEDWRDVYSTMLYSALEGEDGLFLVSTSHGPILLNSVGRSSSVLVVSSEDDPFVFNYPDMMTGRGFEDVEEIEVDSANLDLLEEMERIDDFVIVGNDFGYNAIAVTQYAKVTDSWVFLADRANIDEIDRLISGRDVGDVLIYGYVDREVGETLSKYDPEEINTGDKFKDNVEIMKKYLEISPTKQIVLTNGEFIEKEIIFGDSPILFTGKENVPDQIRDYLRSSEIEVGVLIGNDLINAATNIKRTAGINVIAKFARGARGVTGSAVATVEGLDLFYSESPRLELIVHSIKYNKALDQLEITYQSNSNVPAYFKGTLEVFSEGETDRFGDLNPIFIAPGDFKTVSYSDVALGEEDNLSVDVYTLYGEVESALDRVLSGVYDVEVVDVIDSCKDNVEISGLTYNKQKKMFYVQLDNIGEVDCYADVEMRDVMINEMETTISSLNVVRVSGGDSEKVLVEQEMTEEDLADNDIVEVYAYYGENSDSLVYQTFSRLEVDIDLYTFMTWMIIVLVPLIVLLVIIAIVIRRREDGF